MEESTPTPPPLKPPGTAPAQPAPALPAKAVIPPAPSPSTTPEPEMNEPGAGAAIGVVALMAGIAIGIVVLIAAIAVSIVFAVRGYSIKQIGHESRAVPAAVSPPPAVAPMVPPMPVAVAPPSPPAAPSTSPATPSAALPLPPVDHGPYISSMTPDHGNADDIITLRGNALAGIDDLILFPQHGGAAVEAAVMSTGDREMTFSVPAVEKPEGFQPGDGYYVGAFGKNGAALLVDSSFHTTDHDTGQLRQDAVHVRSSDSFTGRDHLLVFADSGATVSVGDSCVVLLQSNCTLSHYGDGCKIFYVAPLHVGGDPNADGLIPLPSVRLNVNGARMMLKPLGNPGLPPDPNAP